MTIPGNLNTTAMAVMPHTDVERALVTCAGQFVKHPVGRRKHRDLPARVHERRRQVAHDVPDAANLSTAQRAVLGREEDDVLLTDGAGPA